MSNKIKSLNIKISILGLLILFIALGIGCSKGPKTTIRTGKVKIAVDETIAPIIETELKTFKNQSKDAEIEVIYVNEVEAMQLFLNDSVQLAIVPRKLYDKEKDYFTNVRKYPASTTPFAMDGLVFITHPENPDSLMTQAQIADILTGKIKNWEDMNNPKDKKTSLGKIPIQVVFDQNNSSLLRFSKDSIAKGNLSQQLTAAKSNPNVLDYVMKNKNALGVIGYNWISNTDDAQINELRSKIKMVGIYNEERAKHYNLDNDVMYRLAYKRYPYRRTLYIHNREPYVGLATGFCSFLAGKEGQKIAYRANLIPVSGLTRLVEIKEEKVPEVVKE